MTEKKKTEYNLNDTAAGLLFSEPFFAAISRRINKIRCPEVGTAGVRIHPRTYQFELLYNPEWMGNLKSDAERLAVLKHEYYHIIFGHITGRIPIDKANKNILKIWNIAGDLAINSHLDDIPEGCCMPGKGQFKDMAKGESMEWYYSRLRDLIKEMQKNGEGKEGDGIDGSGQFDDHSNWVGEGRPGKASNKDAKGNPIDGDFIKEKIREMTKRAVNEAQSRGWGTVSSTCKTEILERIRTKINWKSVLRYFIKVSQRSDKSSTPRRLNKRYPYIHSGKRINRHAKIAISIDQSGSVSDAMLMAFFSALDELAKLAEFTVIPFDHTVDESGVFVWKKKQRAQAKRTRCGGTCFDAPTDYVNERQFDGHIILTDLEAPAPKPSKCQRMWITTRDHMERPYFQTNEVILAVD